MAQSCAFHAGRETAERSGLDMASSGANLPLPGAASGSEAGRPSAAPAPEGAVEELSIPRRSVPSFSQLCNRAAEEGHWQWSPLAKVSRVEGSRSVRASASVPLAELRNEALPTKGAGKGQVLPAAAWRLESEAIHHTELELQEPDCRLDSDDNLEHGVDNLARASGVIDDSCSDGTSMSVTITHSGVALTAMSEIIRPQEKGPLVENITLMARRISRVIRRQIPPLPDPKWPHQEEQA